MLIIEYLRKKSEELKKNKKTKCDAQDLWNTIKRSNIWFFGVSEYTEKNGLENVRSEIIENFPNLEKDMDIHMQEAQRLW